MVKNASARVVFALCLLGASAAHATTYYVANGGNDNNSGTLPITPWATLSKVNAWVYQPGDQILLKRGSVWQGLLLPCTTVQCSGAPGAPIVIDSYDVGTAQHPPPRINGAGSGRATISLVNQSYWEIRNLEVTNHGPAGFDYEGIELSCDSPLEAKQVCRHVYLSHNYIHDINSQKTPPEAIDQHDAGILVMRNINSTRWKGLQLVSNSNYWDDVLIEYNTVENMTWTGILVTEQYNLPPDPLCTGPSSLKCAMDQPMSTNVRIRNNALSSIGGHGILTQWTNGAVIEYNTLTNWGTPGGPNAAGIWSAGTKNTTIQHNEVSGGTCCADRQAFDIDFANISTYIQYNYSHNNYGGMLLFYEAYDPNPLENFHGGYIDDPIVRFNISVNDGAEGVVGNCGGHWQAGKNPLDFTNNSIYQSATNYYTGQPNVTQIFALCGSNHNRTSGTCDGPGYTGPVITGEAYVINNIFYVDGHATYPRFDGTGFGANTFYSPNIAPTCEPGDGGKRTDNPQFASFPAAPSELFDFLLRAGSPALGTGTDAKFQGPVDYFGNPVNPPFSRGAYAGPGL